MTIIGSWCARIIFNDLDEYKGNDFFFRKYLLMMREFLSAFSMFVCVCVLFFSIRFDNERYGLYKLILFP